MSKETIADLIMLMVLSYLSVVVLFFAILMFSRQVARVNPMLWIYASGSSYDRMLEMSKMSIWEVFDAAASWPWVILGKFTKGG